MEGEPAASLDEQFAAGDDALMARVVARWSPLVYALAFRSLRNVEDAEDVCQRVMLAAWRSRSRYDCTRASLAAWLAGITRHAIADVWEVRHRRSDLQSALEVVERVGPSSAPIERVVTFAVDNELSVLGP